MSIVDQMRAQQAQKQASGSGLLPLAIAAVAAFAISAAVVLGWTMLPHLMANVPGATSKADPTPTSWGAARVGHAEAAPLLRACVPFHLFGLEPMERAQPADLYRLLQAGSHVARIGAMIGVQQEGADSVGFAVLWREVADCVYRQNGRMLCDPDNRALAIEAVNSFVRQADIALAEGKAPPRPDGFAQTMAKVQDKRAPNRLDYELQSLRSTKDRVLATLRSKVQDGRLIASDFGYLAPAAVKQTLRDAKTVRNACADEKL